MSPMPRSPFCHSVISSMYATFTGATCSFVYLRRSTPGLNQILWNGTDGSSYMADCSTNPAGRAGLAFVQPPDENAKMPTSRTITDEDAFTLFTRLSFQPECGRCRYVVSAC